MAIHMQKGIFAGRLMDRDAMSEQTRENVARFASATPQILDQRLCELDCAWDVERTAQVGVAGLTLVGLAAAAYWGVGWWAVPIVGASLLLIQAIWCWSPLSALLSCCGLRTRRDHAQERYALKALRGDFQRLTLVNTPQDLEDHSRFEGEGGPPAPEPPLAASDPSAVDEALRAAR